MPDPCHVDAVLPSILSALAFRPARLGGARANATPRRGADLGAAPGFLGAQSRRHHAGAGGRGRAAGSGRRRHRRISRRDARRQACGTWALAARNRRPRRSPPPDPLVQRQVLRGSLRRAGDGAHLQTLHSGGPGRRPARYRHAACRARQYSLPSGLYRLAGAHPRLARRRKPDFCRSGRGGAFVRRRLSGRSAVGRRQDREGLVRANKIAAGVPRAAHRDAGGATAGAKLRRSRLLTPAALKAALADAARAQGFDVIGVARPDAIPLAAERLRTFLAGGAHGDMDWMAAKADRRGDPSTMWPDVRSIVLLGVNYGPRSDPLAILKQRTRGAISVYAQGDDYHEVIKPRLKKLGRWLIEQAGGDIKVFVDTAAVMEKPLAEAAGLGWQGKHTNLVSLELGSWLFLGAIFTTLELPPDAPAHDHCGTCHACLDVCPTEAFPAPYRLDARRCISYLTIEHKGAISRELRPLMGNRIYGCDDCLAVCPWNKFAQTTTHEALRPRGDLTAPILAELAMLDDAGFRRMFSGSPIKRIGRDRFVRNVANAIGNSG